MSLSCHFCSVPVTNPHTSIGLLKASFFFWPEYKGKRVESARDYSTVYHPEHSLGRIPEAEIRTRKDILNLLVKRAHKKYQEFAKGNNSLCTAVDFPFYFVRENIRRVSPPGLQALAEQEIHVEGNRDLFFLREVVEAIAPNAPIVSSRIKGYITEASAKKYLPELFREFKHKKRAFSVSTPKDKKAVIV